MPQTERLTLAQAVAQMTPEKLEVWLESQPATREFICGDPVYCVIAEYLEAKTGKPVHVDGRLADKSFSLPGWVRGFIFKFDEYDVPTSRSTSDALRILRECCPELKGQHATS